MEKRKGKKKKNPKWLVVTTEERVAVSGRRSRTHPEWAEKAKAQDHTQLDKGGERAAPRSCTEIHCVTMGK